MAPDLYKINFENNSKFLDLYIDYTMKKLLSLFLVTFLLIGACGCMVFKRSNSFETKMVQYMNDKYTDDTFTYKDATGGGAGADAKTIIVSSEKYPDQNIYVRYMPDTTPEYTDNYLSVIYAAQTKALITDVLDQVLDCDYLLIYAVSRYACPNADGMLSFADYVGASASCIGFTVVAKEMVADKAQFEADLEKAIVDAGLCCSATIYFDNGSGAFDTLTAEGLAGYTFKKLYSDVFSFKMSSKEAFSSVRWEE